MIVFCYKPNPDLKLTPKVLDTIKRSVAKAGVKITTTRAGVKFTPTKGGKAYTIKSR